MRKKKKFGLFEKLTGSIHMDDYDDEFFDDEEMENADLYASLDQNEDLEDYPEEEYEEERTPLKKKLSPASSPSPQDKRPQPLQAIKKESPSKLSVINNSLPHHDEEIPLDIMETGETIFIRAEITGVDPDTIDIDLTRDSLVLSAMKKEQRIFGDNEYIHREIHWGEIGRSVDLPEEIEVEEAEAHAEFGILLITLPKIDKARKTKLRVGSKKKPAIRKV